MAVQYNKSSDDSQIPARMRWNNKKVAPSCYQDDFNSTGWPQPLQGFAMTLMKKIDRS